MPKTSTGWAVDPFATWRNGIRDSINGALGFDLDYLGTPEGALVDAIAADLWALDQGGQSIVDMLSPQTAAPGQLAVIGEAERIPRKAATKTRYTAAATFASGHTTYTFTAGQQFTVSDAVSDTTWVVVENKTVTSADMTVLVDSAVSGAVTLANGTILSPTVPIIEIDTVAIDTSEPLQLGSDIESLAAYRVRLARLSASQGGTIPGWLRSIYDVSFIQAASIQVTSPATVLIRIVPQVTTDGQRDELAAAILAGAPAGILYDASSAHSWTTPDPYGGTRTVKWTDGLQQAVDASVYYVLAEGFVDADVMDAIDAAYDGIFAGFLPGDGVYWDDFITTMAAVQGVARLVMMTGSTAATSINGAQVDVAPSLSTNMLIPGTVTKTKVS